MNINRKKRIEWIDFSKGIAILLVIIGHGVGGPLRGIIFSFHMPLFFILSSSTFKMSNNEEDFFRNTTRGFKHLVVPAIFIYIIVTIILFIKNFNVVYLNDISELKKYLSNVVNIFVYSSGVPVQLGRETIGAIGIPWFFMVLFLGRSTYDFLNLKFANKKFYFLLAFLTLAGIILGGIQWLPFSFDIALAIMPFFYVGQFLKKIDIKRKNLQFLLFYFCLWCLFLLLTVYFSSTYLELAVRRYPVFPLSYLTALFGTLFVAYFSEFFLKFKCISSPIIYLGRNSLYMLLIHILDFQWSSLYTLTSLDYINTIIRIIQDILLFVLLMFVLDKYKNRVESIKQ